MNMWVRVRRGLVVAGLLLVMSFIGATSSVVLAAPGERAGATTLVVEGNRRVDTDTIRSYFKAEAGGRLTAADIDAGLKALYASGLFQDIHIAQQGEKVIVTVVEASVIDRVTFEGNRHIKDE